MPGIPFTQAWLIATKRGGKPFPQYKPAPPKPKPNPMRKFAAALPGWNARAKAVNGARVGSGGPAKAPPGGPLPGSSQPRMPVAPRGVTPLFPAGGGARSRAASPHLSALVPPPAGTGGSASAIPAMLSPAPAVPVSQVVPAMAVTPAASPGPSTRGIILAGVAVAGAGWLLLRKGK